MHLEGMWVMEEMAEKLCENCGESLREATVFCPRCGARIQSMRKSQVYQDFGEGTKKSL